MALTQKAERAALNKLIDYLDENPEEHIPQIMELIDKLVPASVFPAQRTAISSAIRDRSNWYELIMRIFHLNPSMRSRLLKTLIVDANLLAWPVQQKSREREQCNIPWAIQIGRAHV